mgnify:CR=1 FL=1
MASVPIDASSPPADCGLFAADHPLDSSVGTQQGESTRPVVPGPIVAQAHVTHPSSSVHGHVTFVCDVVRDVTCVYVQLEGLHPFHLYRVSLHHDAPGSSFLDAPAATGPPVGLSGMTPTADSPPTDALESGPSDTDEGRGLTSTASSFALGTTAAVFPPLWRFTAENDACASVEPRERAVLLSRSTLQPVLSVTSRSFRWPEGILATVVANLGGRAMHKREWPSAVLPMLPSFAMAMHSPVGKLVAVSTVTVPLSPHRVPPPPPRENDAAGLVGADGAGGTTPQQVSTTASAVGGGATSAPTTCAWDVLDATAARSTLVAFGTIAEVTDEEDDDASNSS